VHPVPERDALEHLEHLVLAELDPPLNLDGMADTSVRLALKAGRPDVRSSAAYFRVRRRTDGPSLGEDLLDDLPYR